MSRVIAAFTQFFDGNGDPLVNGWLRFLQSSTNNTFKNTYADANLSLPNENPLQLDAEGRCPNVFGQGSYRVDLFYNNTVTNAPGELVQSFDPVSTFDTPAGTGGNFAEWVNTTVYQVSNIVIYNGLYYRSITADNLGNPPDTNTDQWEQIAFLRYYNPDVVYNEDEIVISDGALYFSLADLNQGNTPLTSPVYWGAVGAGTVLLSWEEFGTVLRPVVSGYNIGDPTHYVGEMYLTAFADFPVTPSLDPTADYHITNKLYVDTEVSTRVRHLFEWTPGQTYYLNEQVRDDNWTMIANTTTEERPAPQAVGDIVWVRDSFSPPAFSETNQSEPTLYVVQRYEFTPAFTVRRCRIFIPTSGIGLNCEVWAVYSPLTNSRIIQLVPPFEVSEDEAGDWKYIDVNNVYVESGSLVDAVMVLREPTGASTFAYEWEYTVATGDPASGQMAHQRGANIDKLRIHEEDSGAVDRSAFLDLLHPGSTIYKPDDGYTWEVLSISKTGQIYYLTVDPGAHGSESTQTFTFTYFASSAISYVYNTDLYVSDSRITGFVTNEYDPVGATPTDDGYGIDILVQNMIASTDWDVISQPPLGGESPGGGTTLLYWEEVGNIFRPITSGAGQFGDATHLINDIFINQMTFDGVTITDYSTDDTLSGDSDTTFVSESAIKGYVDTSVFASSIKHVTFYYEGVLQDNDWIIETYEWAAGFFYGWFFPGNAKIIKLRYFMRIPCSGSNGQVTLYQEDVAGTTFTLSADVPVTDTTVDIDVVAGTAFGLRVTGVGLNEPGQGLSIIIDYYLT